MTLITFLSELPRIPTRGTHLGSSVRSMRDICVGSIALGLLEMVSSPAEAASEGEPQSAHDAFPPGATPQNQAHAPRLSRLCLLTQHTRRAENQFRQVYSSNEKGPDHSGPACWVKEGSYASFRRSAARPVSAPPKSASVRPPSGTEVEASNTTLLFPSPLSEIRTGLPIVPRPGKVDPNASWP